MTIQGACKRIQEILGNLARRLTCRYVSYGMFVSLVRGMLCNPVGRRRALRRSAGLFAYLDELGIEYDPEDTAIRARMLRKLFPWANCRFLRCPPGELERWVSLQGLEHVTASLERGRGVLLVSNHFCPGHMIEDFLRARDYRVYVMRWTDKFVRQYGVSNGNSRLANEIYFKDDSSSVRLRTVTTIRDLLSRGEIVRIALDGLGGRGQTLQVSCLGEERPFRLAVPLIAGLVDAAIVLAFVTLKADGRMVIRFNEPCPTRPPDQAPLEYAKDVIRAYAAELDKFCRSEPCHMKLKRIHLRASPPAVDRA